MGENFDRLAVSAAFAQAAHDGSFDDDLAAYLSLLGTRRPVLFFAFAPKAAGTFLRTAAIEATGGQLVRIAHALGGREAQPYLPLFLQYYLGGVCDCALVAHAHIQALAGNRHFLEVFGIRPIIMLRPLADMLASYQDMLEAVPESRADGLNCVIPDAFGDFSPAQKSDFMIDIIAPWYVSYFATWIDYTQQRPDQVCVLHYADFLGDPVSVLENALAHAGLARPRAVCERALSRSWRERGALRFNRGVSGRGRAYFSPEQIERLSRMFAHHSVLDGWREKLL
jgi:hypothetical protein